MAWEEFVRRFHPLISGVAYRVARSWGEIAPQVIDDLVQETYLKLCTDGMYILRNFESAHPDAIYGYIKVFTANLAHDHFRSQGSKKRGGSVPTLPLEDESGTVGAGSIERNVYRNLLLQQVDACLQRINSGINAKRDRRIFWLYYRVGLPAIEIAALPAIGLSTKGVESTLLRMTREVRAALATRKRQTVAQEELGEGISPAETL